MSGAATGLVFGATTALTTMLLAAPGPPRHRRRPRELSEWSTRSVPPPSSVASGPTLRRCAVALAGVVAVLVAALVAPPLVVPIVASGWAAGRRRDTRSRRATARAVTRALPDAVDLLLLCTSAGQSLPLAHPLVAGRIASPIGDALRLAASEADAGRPRADALIAALAPLGERADGLAHALADHLRYGMPLTETLERWSAELRGDRRRQAEEAARRAPVRLLAPLIVCVLPAFALLTVVPLLVSSLQALPT